MLGGPPLASRRVYRRSSPTSRRCGGGTLLSRLAGQQARLAQQLPEVESLTVGNLDRDLLVDPGIVSEVDGTESAATERSGDLVFTECLAPEEQC